MPPIKPWPQRTRRSASTDQWSTLLATRWPENLRTLRTVPDAHGFSCGFPCLQAEVATDNPGTCPQTTGGRCRTRTSGLAKGAGHIFTLWALSAPVLSAAPRQPCASRSGIFAAKRFLTRSTAPSFSKLVVGHPLCKCLYIGSGFSGVLKRICWLPTFLDGTWIGRYWAPNPKAENSDIRSFEAVQARGDYDVDTGGRSETVSLRTCRKGCAPAASRLRYLDYLLAVLYVRAHWQTRQHVVISL